MRAFSATFRRILDFWMSVTLQKIILAMVVNTGMGCLATYLICVSEPGGSFLLAADQCNPFIAASTQSLPDIRVSIHPSRFLRFLEWAASSSTNSMGETLIVPEGAVL